MAKKSISTKKLFLILLVLAVTAVAFCSLVNFFNRPKFTRYAAFGIDIPVNYSIHGIDVSRYQSLVDWKEVQAMKIENISLGFGFIKATEGVDDVDEQFKKNWRSIKKTGMTRGAYHFFNPMKSGVAQAQNFIDRVKLESGDLPPVLDIESLQSANRIELRKRLTDWLKLVEVHYHVKPIIYSNPEFYENNLAGKFDDYPLWVAHYFAKDKPRVRRNWLFWQHNEAGHVNGIDAYVDFNVFNGDSADFKKLLIK